MDDYEDKGSVKFNAGFFQVQRIHEVQRMINIAKINPQSFNYDYNIWNYELWFNCLNTLIDEIWPKLYSKEQKHIAKDEKGETDKFRDQMLKMIDNFKVVEQKFMDGYSDKKVTLINKQKFSKIHRALIYYDNYVKGLMNEHGWNNPDGEFEAADEY